MRQQYNSLDALDADHTDTQTLSCYNGCRNIDGDPKIATQCHSLDPTHIFKFSRVFNIVLPQLMLYTNTSTVKEIHIETVLDTKRQISTGWAKKLLS